KTKHVARSAMSALGGIAGGEPAAVSGAKRMKSRPEVTRQRLERSRSAATSAQAQVQRPAVWREQFQQARSGLAGAAAEQDELRGEAPRVHDIGKIQRLGRGERGLIDRRRGRDQEIASFVGLCTDGDDGKWLCTAYTQNALERRM